MPRGESTDPRTTTRRTGGTRATMVRTAAILLGENGVAGTTIDEVLRVSGAPRGSVYHHFPAGRAELLTAAVEHATETILDFARGADGLEPATVLDAFVDYWRRRLIESDFRAGCPVVAAAVDADPSLPELSELAADAFTRWQDALAAVLVHGGMAGEAAQRQALQSLCLLEGAVVLCRARRELTPLDAAAEAIGTLYRSELRRSTPQ